jgi:hypothetical protein
MVLLDAYRGTFVPFHLLTEEFYTEVKQHLTPGGVVVENISDEVELADSTLATLQHEFQQVECFRVGDNLVAVAYDGPRKPYAELVQHAADLDAQYRLPYSLVAMLRGRTEAAIKPGVKPLTDEFAPVETLNAIARRWDRSQPLFRFVEKRIEDRVLRGSYGTDSALHVEKGLIDSVTPVHVGSRRGREGRSVRVRGTVAVGWHGLHVHGFARES